MDTLSYKTKSVSKQEAEHNWVLIDLEGQIVGKAASKIADILRGKNKPSFTPHADTGDFVICINADKVRFTGNKWAQKEYQRYSGYPGGQSSATAEEVKAKFPERIIENAVRGMLPKNKLGRAVFRKLHVYNGASHPHTAQKPSTITI